MSKVMLSESYLEDIADAIRAKTGTQDTYTPGEMPEAIEAISGGGITPTGTISITSNGTVDVTQYASADVNVPSVTPTGTINITQNGTTDVTNYASANVNVPNPSTGTKQISITQNGTTTENVTDYANAEITVNVSGSGVNRDTITYTVASQTVNPKVPTVATDPSKILCVYFYTKDLVYPTNSTCYEGIIIGPALVHYVSAASSTWLNYRTSSTGANGFTTSGSGTGGAFRDSGYVYLGAPSSMPFKANDNVIVEVLYTD